MFVLESGYVYTIDAVRGVGESLTTVSVGMPFAQLERCVEASLIAKSLFLSICPSATIHTACGVLNRAMPAGSSLTVQLASVYIALALVCTVVNSVGAELPPYLYTIRVVYESLALAVAFNHLSGIDGSAVFA